MEDKFRCVEPLLSPLHLRGWQFVPPRLHHAPTATHYMHSTTVFDCHMCHLALPSPPSCSTCPWMPPSMHYHHLWVSIQWMCCSSPCIWLHGSAAFTISPSPRRSCACHHTFLSGSTSFCYTYSQYCNWHTLCISFCMLSNATSITTWYVTTLYICGLII